MYLSAITTQFDGMTPEIKFFLVKYLYKYGEKTAVEISVKDMAAALGVANHLASKSLAYLIDHQYLKREVCGAEKGRPISRYECERKLKDVLLKAPARPGFSFNKSLIDELLRPDQSTWIIGPPSRDLAVSTDNHSFQPKQKPARLVRRHQLDFASRLFIAVLLSYADTFGIVDGVGMGHISKCTGMAYKRLDSQLRLLKRLGYIRAHTSGISCRYLFGKRTSIYFLNITHSAFASTARVAVATATTKCFQGGHNDWAHQGENIYDLAAYVSTRFASNHTQERGLANTKMDELSRSFRWDKNVFEVVHFFSDSIQSGAAHYLQSKLEEYASELLSDFWLEILGEQHVNPKSLRSRISADIIDLRLLRVGPPIEYSKAHCELLIDFIIHVALSMAEGIQKVMVLKQKVELKQKSSASASASASKQDFPLQNMAHRIRPFTEGQTANGGVGYYTVVDSFL